MESVGQFYHIMSSVEQIEGTVRLDGGKLERTQYTSCVNTRTLSYYYTTYEDPCPTEVCLMHERLDSVGLISYPLTHEMSIKRQN